VLVADQAALSADRAVRELVACLNLSAGALSVLAAAIDGRTTGRAFDPGVQPHVDAVLDALEARKLIEGLSPVELQPVLAEIHLTILQSARLLREGMPEPGWAYTDPDISRAAGETSAGFAAVLKQVIAPRLPGLSERLEASGSFLDVGVGVAGLSFAMSRLWPRLRVVGLDLWAPSLVIARENVLAAALTDRIELRHQAAEDLTDVDAFDLAWIPSAFIPDKSITAIAERVYHALRPDGWLLFAMINLGSDALASSYARLRTAIWGGALLPPTEAQTMLERIGYVAVQMLPAPPSATVAIVAGRRRSLTTRGTTTKQCGFHSAY
jgi:SAM-dependent methyltransferase